MGLFNNKPKKLKSRKITLAQAIEYAKNPEYNKLYEFIPVDENNIHAGYIPQLKTEMIQKNSIPVVTQNNKRNQSFINRIEAGGIYKGIDRNINKNKENQETKYGNYKSAKRYKGDIR